MDIEDNYTGITDLSADAWVWFVWYVFHSFSCYAILRYTVDTNLYD